MMSKAYQDIRAYAELHGLHCKDYLSTRGFDVLTDTGKRVYTVFDGAYNENALDTVDDGEWNRDQKRIRTSRNVGSVKRTIRRMATRFAEEAYQRKVEADKKIVQAQRESEAQQEAAFISKAMKLNQEFAALVDQELDLATTLSSVQARIKDNHRHWNELLTLWPVPAKKWKGRRDLGVVTN